MDIEWRLDGDGDWNLYVNGNYEGLLCNRFTKDGTYRVFVIDKHELGLVDPEEAKAAAFAIWVFNK